MLLALSLAQAGQLAVTVDDLPWAGATRPGETPLDATHRLLEVFTSRDLVATGFVNCDRGQAPVVQAWAAAGQQLGNHHASHASLEELALADWSAGVRRCDAWLRDQGVWSDTFRYPYLRQGSTADKRDGAYALLDELGLRPAHVTVDNSEWALAKVYGEALQAGDGERAAGIAEHYRSHLVEAVAHYEQVATQKLGRDVPQVLLLHANALNADHLGAVLDALAAGGWSFVSLDEALADPVNQQPDAILTPGGWSWLYRIEPVVEDPSAQWDGPAYRGILERWSE